MAKTKDVAEWMLKEVSEKKYLEQESAVYDIQKNFGEEFVYVNENGNLAIERRVLTAFNKISSDTVVWLRGEKAWAPRESYHSPGRQQD